MLHDGKMAEYTFFCAFSAKLRHAIYEFIGSCSTHFSVLARRREHLSHSRWWVEVSHTVGAVDAWHRQTKPHLCAMRDIAIDVRNVYRRYRRSTSTLALFYWLPGRQAHPLGSTLLSRDGRCVARKFPVD